MSSYSDLKKKIKQGGTTSGGYQKIKEKYKSGGISLGVDEDYINTFITDANSFLTSAETDYKGITWGNASPTYDSKSKTYSDLSQRADLIDSWLKMNKGRLDPDTYDSLSKSLKSITEGTRSVMDGFSEYKNHYAKWETEEDYKAAVKAEQDKAEQDEELKTYDLKSAKAELEALEAEYEAYRAAKLGNQYKGYMTGPSAYSKTIESINSKYGSTKEFEALVSQKRQKYALAERIQKGIAMTEEALNAPDFDKYVKDAFGEAESAKEAYDVADDKTKGMLSVITEIAIASGNLDAKAVKYAKDEELLVYFYYKKKYGKKKANEYLDILEETLNERRGQDIYAYVKDSVFLEYAFGAAAGLDQFASGLENLFSDEDYIPYTEYEYASSLIREDLEDTGFKLPDWMGGASIGQVGYDMVTTTSNMLPSILVSTIPVVGQVAGATLLGASAAGNAKAEMLRLGYSQEQATTYGVLVGASEGVLQYALGGISKLSGGNKGVFQTLASKFASQVDRGLAKGAINLAGNILDEGLEEALQSILEPYFKSMATAEDVEAINWEEVVYSGLLGMATAGAFEGGGAGVTKVANEVAYNQQLKQHGQSIIDKGGVDSLKAFALETAGVNQNKQGQKIANLAGKVSHKASAKNVGKLSAYLQETISTQDKTNIRNALIKKGLSEKEASRISEYLYNVSRGAEFSEAEIAELESNDKIIEVLRDVVPTAMNNAINLASARLGNNTPTATKATPATENPTEEESPTESKFAVSESGKTTYNGNDVSIKDIVSIKNGEVELLLDNGETVNARDVGFANEDEGLIYEAVADMDIDRARDFIQGFNASKNAPLATPQTAKSYMLGFNEAYGYGRYGIPEEVLERDGKYSKSLSGGQKKIAYNRGAIDAELSVGSAQEKVNNAASNAKPNKSKANGRVTYDKGVRGTLAKGSKEAESVKLIEFFNTHFSHAKVRIYASYVDENGRRVFRDTDGKIKRAPNGMYMPDGSIALDLNSGENGEGLILYSFSHELTHMAKRLSPEKYKAYADFLFKHYGENQSVEQLIVYEINFARKKGRKLSREDAYDEAVARASERMLVDVLNGTAQSKLAELNTKHKDIFEKIKEFFAKLIASIKELYKDTPSWSDSANIVHDMQNVAEQLQAMWLDMVTDAGRVNSALGGDTTSLLFAEEVPDVVSVEDATAYSYRSLAEAAGFEAIEENGSRMFVRNGSAVSKVTVEDIENSPIGAFINYSLEMKDITEADAKKQKQMFADICTMACKTNDFSMAMQFVGSAVFTGMKANADKQYGTTYDFPSICTKTQAVIDAMSKRMVTLGRGLNSTEIIGIYRDVFASGNPVPCPECYVFSRWIGIGGLLDNIKKYQDYYGEMSVTEVAEAYKEMHSQVAAFAEEQKISFGKAKGALTSKLTKEYNKLTEKIEKAENQGEKVNESDRKRLAEIEPMMNTVKAMTWIENVYFADSALTKVNPKFRVPNEVLFDLNKGEAFASQYKEAWAFRTTQGAGYGKAITPYAEARLGEGILVTNNTTNAIKGKANGTLNNYFLQQKGQMDAQARKTLDKAREKQQSQAFIGSQRFQSTSDARYENASDYLLAALEMQAMHGKVQVYTKVDGAVAAFEAWGFSTNQSLMPKGSGLDAEGNVQDTSVGGMHPRVATENRNKYEHAGTITIGVNDNHIRALYKLTNRDFVIPYHASGGKADVVAEFRTIQEGMEKRGEMVRSTDYSRTQSDKVLSDEVLKWLGKTDAEIEQIHKVREARIGILTRSKVDMDVVRGNRFLSTLYDKLHGEEWGRVKLAKGKVASQIFPNEFWDTSVSYEESGKITKDYLEYCDDLGFLHRFSGLVPSNGMLVPVKGYDENGNKVTLTDLAYKYDENGQKTNEVEDFYWKNIVDRRMYGHNGQYLPQKFVTLNDTTTDTVTSFAKNNYGRQYNKELSLETADKVANKLYSDRDNVGINALEDPATVTSDFVTHMTDLVKANGSWYGKDVFKYVESHPELNFIDRIYEKDKQVKKDLETFLNTVNDTKVLDLFSWYMGGAYSDKGRTWSWDEGSSYPYRGAVRTFRNAVKKRINEIVTEKVGGTNLGVKNGDVSLGDIKDMFYRLNSNEEIGEFAKKVFDTAEKLGVNIRFVNQTFAKNVSGDQWGDMVEYKTSYFNDTAHSDQRKAQTILHELIHSCTSYVLETHKFIGDVSFPGKSADYERFVNAASRLNRIYSLVSADPDFKGQYGIKNPKEMVAELANENFVGLLKKKNLWEQIVDWICQLFGVNRGNSAYDNIRLCVDYILDNPEIAEYKDYSARVRRQARRAGYDVFGKTIDENGGIMYSDRVLMGSLFSGGGTLEAGLAYQMLDKQFGVEYDGRIASVYADNHGDHIQVGKVEDFDISKYDDIFYLHASPVCHNFSSAKHGAKELQTDIDSAKATAKHLETAMPSVFTVENAPRYRKSQSLKIITDKLTNLGYKWDVDVYNSADYGSATSRNRVILRAVKEGELPEKPTKQDRTNSWDKVTKDLWKTLPKASLHSWFVPAIKNTKNLPILDAHGKVNVNKPLLLLTTTSSKMMTFCWEGEICPTLTTKCGEAQLVMPDGNIYNVTPEFMGRIQGLPDDYKYPKAKTRAFTIIGNGIPTHLTKAVVGGVLDSAYEQTHEGKVLYADRNSSSADRYSYEELTSKPDMKVAFVDDSVNYNRADVVYHALKNATSVGYTNENGNAVVHVDDIDTDVIVPKRSLVHGLDRRIKAQAPVLIKIGEVLKNSIRINELHPRADEIKNSYVLVGAAQNQDENLYVANFVVNKYSNEVTEIDVLYSANAKKESAAFLPKITDKSATPTNSAISIAQLLDFVNRYFPDILPESVLRHYGYDARPEGKIGESALYSDRDNGLTDKDRFFISFLEELNKLDETETHWQSSSTNNSANETVPKSWVEEVKSLYASLLNGLRDSEKSQFPSVNEILQQYTRAWGLVSPIDRAILKAHYLSNRQIIDGMKKIDEVLRANYAEAREFSDTDIMYSLREEAPPKKTRTVYKLMKLGEDKKLYPLFIDGGSPVELGVWYNADSPSFENLRDLPSGCHLIDLKTGEALVSRQKKPSKSEVQSADNNGQRWMFIKEAEEGSSSATRAAKQYGGNARFYYNFGINGSGSVTEYALRPGWHAGSLPVMEQIGNTSMRNIRADNFVWVEGEISYDIDYQEEAESNPSGENDIPFHIPKDGAYIKGTSNFVTKGMTWYIAGAFKANRIIGDREARHIVDDFNENVKDADAPRMNYDYPRIGGRIFNAESMALEEGNQYEVRHWERARDSSKQKELAPDDTMPIMYSDRDTAYMDAVNRGDMKTAQKMVDEAAREAGYKKLFYHGTTHGAFTEFKSYGKPMWVTESKSYAETYANSSERGGYEADEVIMPLYAKMYNVLDITSVDTAEDLFDGFGGTSPTDNFKKLAKLIDTDISSLVKICDVEAFYVIWELINSKQFADVARDKGYDTIKEDEFGNITYGVLHPSQLKSADTVTYAKRKNVIPLSERFNPGNNDIRFSERTDDSVSNRSLLANALESVAQNEIEKNKLKEYKSKIDIIEAEQKKLADLRAKIKELSFAKGTRDTKQIKKLQSEATISANRIHTYDRQLLNLESTTALKNVLAREKELVRKRIEQKGREALAKQREKEAEKTRLLLNRISESRKKGIESRSKTKMREKIRSLIKDLNHLLNHGTKERNVKEEMKETVASAITLAEVLFTDDIRNEDIVRLGVDSVTAEESKLLDEYKVILDQIDAIDEQIEGIHKEERPKEERYALINDLEQAKGKLKNKLGGLNQKLKDVFVRERARLSKSKVSEVMDTLINNYASLKESGDDYIKNAYSAEMEEWLKTLKKDFGGTLVRDMSIEQLQEVYDAFKMVQHMVRTSNTLFREGRTEELMTFVSAVQEEIYSRYKDKKDPISSVDDKKNIINTFSWNNLKPVYAFDRLGSATFQKLYWDAVEADNDFARLTTEAGEFLKAQRAAHGFADWDLSKATEFKLADGKVFKLSLEDMMSIYAYSKREQAYDHMTEGGFVFDESNTYTDKPFDGKKFIGNFRIKKKHARLTETYRVDLQLIAKVTGALSAEQKAYVDAMQKYMTDMGQKGNEVSRKLFGIDLFKEKVYMPLQSSKDYLNSNKQALDNAQTQVSLKNNGTTKPTTPGADNPIVLRAFDEVWLEHIDTMSKYCAYVLPIENLTKVFNNVSRIEGQSPMSTQALISAVYGNGARAYFDQYITDLNGGNSIGGYKSPLMSMFSKFKATSVGASLSVIVQQPFAIIRAMDMIRPDYFIPFLRGQKKSNDVDSTWEEIKKYAPVAILKEMGGFDIGSAGTTKDYIGITEYRGAKGKLKGLAKDSKYRKKAFDDAIMYGATKADELGWSIIWKAVKKEVATEQKLTPGTDEFLKAVGKRFTEVIVRTQVYDSVNSRSGIMRSKNDLNKFATSFMGEATTTTNMFFNAGLKVVRAIKSKDKAQLKQSVGHMARTSGVILASIVLTSLAKSAIYANRDRDDEEDESWTERWMRNFGESLSSDLNPLTMIPYLRDLVSIYEGWDVERPDMTLFADVITTAKRCLEDGATEEEILALCGNIANMFGIPAKNVVRDVKGIINLIKDHFDDIETTDAGGAFERGWTGEEQSQTDALYEAIINGDTLTASKIRENIIDTAIANGDSEEEAEESVASGFRTNCRKAYINGDITRNKAMDMLVEYGGKDSDEAYWELKKWDYVVANGSDEGYSKYGNFYEAVRTGKNIKAVIREYTSHGVTTKTLASQITSYFKPLYKNMSNSERTYIKGYLLNAYELLGYNRYDKAQDINKWLTDN